MSGYKDTPTIGIVDTGAGSIEIQVSYTIFYTPDELLFPEGWFDSVALFESDKGAVSGGDHLFDLEPRFFFPRSTEETRTFSILRTRDQLGTESGGEEIYAVVHHVRGIQGLKSNRRRTAGFPLAV
ncbi:hypothetical protein PV721_25655 [Streptomyces sp. MB09-01]|uniref:hypothetical protein n=1 Tax=Streptomyces sp. MB09-01 TaxID=3028666 RepID=UPI0029A20E4D|nr:hypothetical protein [Streptomyces sp. MB09-01]MDX3537692.1 hypothetical protein [Streptomyces sp. MB09-01]